MFLVWIRILTCGFGQGKVRLGSGRVGTLLNKEKGNPFIKAKVYMLCFSYWSFSFFIQLLFS